MAGFGLGCDYYLPEGISELFSDPTVSGCVAAGGNGSHGPPMEAASIRMASAIGTSVGFSL